MNVIKDINLTEEQKELCENCGTILRKEKNIDKRNVEVYCPKGCDERIVRGDIEW